MEKFSAKKVMAALVSRLTNRGFCGVDIDGHYDIADESQTHAYADGDLDLVEAIGDMGV